MFCLNMVGVHLRIIKCKFVRSSVPQLIIKGQNITPAAHTKAWLYQICRVVYLTTQLDSLP